MHNRVIPIAQLAVFEVTAPDHSCRSHWPVSICKSLASSRSETGKRTPLGLRHTLHETRLTSPRQPRYGHSTMRYGPPLPCGPVAGRVAGPRLPEVCGLRVDDVGFMRGVAHPVQQHPADPLKPEISRTPVPIPQDLALALSRHVEDYSTRGCCAMRRAAARPVGPLAATWQLERKCQGCRRGSGSTTATTTRLC